MSKNTGLHHIHKKTSHKITLTKFDRFMIVVAILYPFSMIPQIAKIYLTQDASSISALTYSLNCLFVVPWFIYGFLHKSKPILCSNVMWFMVYVIIITQTVIY